MLFRSRPMNLSCQKGMPLQEAVEGAAEALTAAAPVALVALMDRRDAATAGLIGFEDILRAMIETQARMYAARLLMVKWSK